MTDSWMWQVQLATISSLQNDPRWCIRDGSCLIAVLQ